MRGSGQEEGFSLIEILVVVAILGLISVVMTIAASNTLKRQRLETVAHEIQSFLNRAYTTTSATGRSAFVWVSAPATDGARTMRIYDDSDNDGIFSSGSDEIIDTQPIPGDLVFSAPPSSTAYRSWPSTSTTNTFIIECDIQGRAVDPPQSSTNSSTTAGIPMTRPAVVSVTHKEMGSGGTLRPNIAYFMTVNLLWQPTIQKWVNGQKVS
jgi:prepilin-type N-terminal cleavage/methylation domain-containing protein